MKLLHQYPAPPLFTGHSPPSQPGHSDAASTNQPRFGTLTPNSYSQFISDTLGVWAPKVPITRSKTQFFEDAFLEFVEDGAFYFTLPVVGPLLGTLLAKTVADTTGWRKNHATLTELAKQLELKEAKDLIGHPMREISKKLSGMSEREAQELLKPIVSMKVGALLGTIGIAAGFEYMIQHAKNYITAKAFKTKNFAAVAGLEKGKSRTQAGLNDPVEKAKKRGKQVGLFVLGTLGAALLAPSLFNLGGANAAKNILRVIDCDKGFDISKPILALIMGTGVASYLDAARDPLERKETGTRLCVVVPYLLFGRELAGACIAKAMENFIKIDVGNGAKNALKIKEIVPFVTGNPFKKMINPDTLLDFNVVDKHKAFASKLTTNPHIQSLRDDALKDQVKAKLVYHHTILRVCSYLVGALGCGLGMNWVIYKQTQRRYKAQLQNTKQQAFARQHPGAQWPSAPNVQPLPRAVSYMGLAVRQPQNSTNPWPTPKVGPTQTVPASRVAEQAR